MEAEQCEGAEAETEVVAGVGAVAVVIAAVADCA